MGGAEFLIIAIFSLLIWALPVAALVWALIILARLRRGQEEIVAHLAVLRATLTDRQ